MLRVVMGLAACLLTVAPASAAFETRAQSAWVADLTTGTVLLEKQSDVPLPPASMSKLMTLYMLFEALRDGRVTMETRFGVSDRAAAMGGSTMYLDQRDRPTVEELIQGIVVQSGNDSTVVVAEGLAGTEDAFARLMNDRAQELGLENSSFTNASGWPNPNHRMSMEDLGRLASLLITEFPEYYGYFAQQEFPFDGRAPQNRFNRNPLLGLGIGADGLKTGHTQEAGYGLVGSAQQGSRRIVFALSGMQSEQERSEEAERVVNWAFRQFVEKTVAEEGQRFGDVPVWMGQRPQVALVAPEAMTVLLPATQRDEPRAEIVYRSPIQAPIEAGEQIAELVIPREDMTEARLPLVAERAVPAGGFVPRIRSAAIILFDKALGEVQALR
ncbi:D-alanyl-D-alanine carboxypeptidase family protein [Roseitranquillus sediminis]|uniref:D-alanyl-D-alanine carboxypeptidase family protein n=1 Tax=Roseitranquillus sediminis TaxID=2809051 RepID=UPI001D0C60CF|nr:D-alanyl-D-alanine carboxypeptidase family protein [Roseitranquillus sediminis]MBM9594722.1 D-alanyl-D-alanine carboxypeptidase [Roseitranquillus sediminis]